MEGEIIEVAEEEAFTGLDPLTAGVLAKFMAKRMKGDFKPSVKRQMKKDEAPVGESEADALDKIEVGTEPARSSTGKEEAPGGEKKTRRD